MDPMERDGSGAGAFLIRTLHGADGAEERALATTLGPARGGPSKEMREAWRAQRSGSKP